MAQGGELTGPQDGGGTPSASEREEFIRSHYELIAGHAEQRSADRWKYIQLSLVGVSVFYAALFSRGMRFGDSIVLDVLAWLPVFLAVFGGLQAFGTLNGIMQRNDVLLRIEKHYEFEGWAHYLDNTSKPVLKKSLISLVNIYWMFLLLLTIAAALAINTNTLSL